MTPFSRTPGRRRAAAIVLGTLLCYAQIAIRGSMLLANRFTANLAHSNPFASIPINAGTSKFAQARGILHTTPVGSANSINLTITYTT